MLKEDAYRPVLRVGDTVRRKVGWWTPAVHGLLRHLEEVGFMHSPRVLGVDGEWEVLTFIAGTSGTDSWARLVPERGLVSVARLLRDYHDAVAGYRPSDHAEWAYGRRALKSGHVVCHGDLGPWNVVWQDEDAVGLVDFDFATPGPPLDDVAYALQYAVPFTDDETCMRWMRYPGPPDRRRRMALFAEVYGLATTEGLVDAVAKRQRATGDEVRALAARGLRPQLEWVTSGQVDRDTRAEWTERNRDLFE